MSNAPSSRTAQTSIELALKADHEELDALFERVMASLRGGDSERIRARWLELDRALEQHLRAEEELILPQFGRDCPADAERVRREHHELRAHLVELGVDLDLHSLSSEAAVRFIQALRRHAAFEQSVVYPWSQTHLPSAEQSTLLGRLRGALRHVDMGAHGEHEQEWT